MDVGKMVWKDEYSVGLREIDEQHKELLSLFNRVTDSLGEAQSWSDVHYRIVELRTFAAYHFEFEEAMMRMFGWPGYDQHSETHRQFFVKLADYEKSSVVGNAQDEMLQFLFVWLFQHIMKSDRAYAEHILSGAPVVRS